MAEYQTQNLLMGSLISSLVGAILILATEFGGWYNYSTYGEVWGWIGFSFSNITSLLVFGLAAGMLFYCFYISYLGVSSQKAVPKMMVQKAFYGSLFVFAVALMGGLYFIVEMTDMDPSTWWLGPAFYAGTIGGGLTMLFLHLVLQNTKK